MQCFVARITRFMQNSLNIQHKLLKFVYQYHHAQPSLVPATVDEIDIKETDINESGNDVEFYKAEI